jgi:6-hydroxycyclohex-1-ene-1-carbonyl-CoA dehydrogenase
VDPGDAVVEIAGCGLCHTDVGFYTGGVETAKRPVILGHEISGTVVAGDEDLVGKEVIVPAVLPCGDCELCHKGRGNICQRQRMPGNHIDGGFASHIIVPARYLCVLPDDLAGYELAELSVVADAVTTPYQGLQRSRLESGELAIVIGVGGLGTYMVQLAKDRGAHVIALDVEADKLERARAMGADHAIDVSGKSERDVKNDVRGLVKTHQLPRTGWKVFELSGTAAGQTTAFSLLSFAGTVGIIGFTMDKVNIRLSNVMAFDADLFGNWGCKPEYYPEVVDLVLGGRIRVKENVETHPLESINDIMKLALEHKLDKRVVFVP